jgi:DNA-binding FadR family transcriptional regulator
MIDLDSELLNYMAFRGPQPGERLPSIRDLASELGISTGKLREQLEVARSLGLVEVRPKTGTRVLDYSFVDSLKTGLLYRLARDPDAFEAFGELRNHVEAAFWHEAVSRLTPEDRVELGQLIGLAWEKLRGRPIQIPHQEHRQLHLVIFRRLENEFVRGLLEAYWEAYEAVGLNVYNDYRYLEEVWQYHEAMVKAIDAGDFAAGYRALVEHAGLLSRRPEMSPYSEESLLDEGQHPVGSEIA